MKGVEAEALLSYSALIFSVAILGIHMLDEGLCNWLKPRLECVLLGVKEREGRMISNVCVCVFNGRIYVALSVWSPRFPWRPGSNQGH